ncbi:helix-turn-helix domain-containing protein [Streptomyces sp. NPDC057363]|uniref:helix-turn-helix domain-containing protein n=1 Tax=Streptomyces sp. NPDC057363 TaxID=3346107 RepID=UPI00363B67E2
MHNLIGRITALDPHLSDALSVVAYFDALMATRASTEALLRGAALLAGCPLSYESSDQPVIRISTAGDRLPTTAADPRHRHLEGSGWRVTLERLGEPHANDEIILERLGMALSVAGTGSHRTWEPPGAVETILSTEASEQQHIEAAARLRLATDGSYRAIARPLGTTPSDRALPVLPTRYGLAWAEITPAAAALDTVDGPAGVGIAAPPSRLADSWVTALTALRLTDELRPICRADDLGALVLLAPLAESGVSPHPDVIQLDALAQRADDLKVLDVLARTTTLREAARLLHLHHSTVQSRLVRASERLGYDPSSPQGRVRYVVARTLQKLRSG